MAAFDDSGVTGHEAALDVGDITLFHPVSPLIARGASSLSARAPSQ
jgi:hypothetical protein